LQLALGNMLMDSFEKIYNPCIKGPQTISDQFQNFVEQRLSLLETPELYSFKAF